MLKNKILLLSSLCLLIIGCERKEEHHKRPSPERKSSTTQRSAAKNQPESAYYYQDFSNMLESVSPDADLLFRVRRELEDDRRLTESTRNIQVFVNGGVVTLMGFVRSDEERYRIADRVRQMTGVRAVNNQIRVSNQYGYAYRTYAVALAETPNEQRFQPGQDLQQPASRPTMGPQDQNQALEQRIRQVLFYDSTLPNGRSIKIDVIQGNVTLRGMVGSEQEKLRINHKVKQMTGVKKVDNRLQVGKTTGRPVSYG